MLYGALCGCSSWRSPVSEKMPQVLASRQAAEKIAVSSPGMVAAMAIISSLSYMMPMVLYSGNTTRSMPGRPSFMPLIISAIWRALSSTSALVCRRGIL